mmetsp:Transcript_2576/g.5081  ORF Transcript_2576/g.5081 Transcript_2576/m.5081 type:complete len:211 (+) Transcript_2576:114-746(+)
MRSGASVFIHVHGNSHLLYTSHASLLDAFLLGMLHSSVLLFRLYPYNQPHHVICAARLNYYPAVERDRIARKLYHPMIRRPAPDYKAHFQVARWRGAHTLKDCSQGHRAHDAALLPATPVVESHVPRLHQQLQPNAAQRQQSTETPPASQLAQLTFLRGCCLQQWPPRPPMIRPGTPVPGRRRLPAPNLSPAPSRMPKGQPRRGGRHQSP